MIEFVIIAILLAASAYLVSAVQQWRDRALKAEGELSKINHTAFDAMANRAGSKPAFSEAKPLPEPTAGFKTGTQLRSEAHQQRVAESLKKQDEANSNHEESALTDMDIAHLKG